MNFIVFLVEGDVLLLKILFKKNQSLQDKLAFLKFLANFAEYFAIDDKNIGNLCSFTCKNHQDSLKSDKLFKILGKKWPKTPNLPKASA